LSTATLVDRLTSHRTISAVPAHEVAWIASHGVLHSLAPGAILTPKQGPVEGLHIVLSGHLSIHVDQGSGRRKLMEWRSGDVTGYMPYSRLVSPPGDVIAEEPSELVTVRRGDFVEMIRECPELTAILVHVMVDRARHFTSSYLHDEKLVSLGKLAAGLAHELNNPASAIGSSAGKLRTAIVQLDEACRLAGAAGLKPEQLERLRQLCDSTLANDTKAVLSPMEQEEREDTLECWLKSHGAAPRIAESLAETSVTVEMLEQLSQSMQGEALNTGLRWLAANCTAHGLTMEIQHSASRISELVNAVRGFTQMDRAAVPEPVELAKGLSNTIAVLSSKAKGKSVKVSMNIEKDLPPVHGFGGELNQIWSNLIDNAIDAVNSGGQIDISARRERNGVVVRVVDNGPGVPADISNCIFDPFFTTKSVGMGTGLGLDIVRRLVQRHNGEIDLESVPGRTEFRVTLPISQSC
jgi:signal transduction histidine kinase